MTSVRHGEGWSASVRDALAGLAPEDQAEFESVELVQIEARIQVRWNLLYVSDSDPYRRTLIESYPPRDPEARFIYTVQARLRSDGDIELEHLRIEWDHSIPDVD